jgi:hypothetical protein
MDQFYSIASEAMKAAYAIAASTHRRVWRHTVDNNSVATCWFISYEKDAQKALQGLTA